MFRRIIKKIDIYQSKKGQNKEQDKAEQRLEEQTEYTLTTDLMQNIDGFVTALGDSADVKKHKFTAGGTLDCALIYLDGMVKNEFISESIVRPMQEKLKDVSTKDLQGRELATAIKDKVIINGDATVTHVFDELITGILSGDTVLLIDGCSYAVFIGTKGYETRAISEPQTELVVRGPREGFNENLRTNTALIRRIIRSPKLRMENMQLGKKTNTHICIMYMDGVANPALVKQVKNRLKAIKVDAILDSGYLEEYIEDSPFSLFPTVGYTEKPDVCTARMLEGRVALIVDGTPFALTMPFLFIENFQTAEDYYIRPLYASILRLMRLFSYFFAIFLLPMYIAMTTYHQELIPTTLLFTIAAAREGTPFPTIVEGLILVVSFEVLREAGLRLPRPIGQAISIVGALIMGDAAVAAGLVGAPMVIIVALCAVATFVTPELVDSISLLRLIFMFIAAALGGFGIALGFLVYLIHLATLNSFGVPYFTTFIFSRDMLDGFIRFPLWTMNKRPKDIAYGDVTRIMPFVPPQVNRGSKQGEDDSSNNESEDDSQSGNGSSGNGEGKNNKKEANGNSNGNKDVNTSSGKDNKTP